MTVLFLAPLKEPDDPVPSGERTMARLFIRLLERLGYEVELASRLRTLIRAPSPEAFAALEAAGAAEVERLLARSGPPPACVFTYHSYYKAPDVIGPALAARLGLPYVLAEASHAPKRASGSYAAGHRLNEAAIRRAALLLVPTAQDREMLERLRPTDLWSANSRLVDLKPFLDLADWPLAGAPSPRAPGPVRLITVAMMRPGDKLASFTQLAAALAPLASAEWELMLVGDGPARAEVEALFAPFGARVRFAGAVTERDALGALLRAADLFVWPGVNEAFGAVYLEAQAHGLPCLAAGYGGIADSVRAGETAILTPPGDLPAFTAALAALIADPARRTAMGAAGARFIAQARDLPRAAATVAAAFSAIGIAPPGPRHDAS